MKSFWQSRKENMSSFGMHRQNIIHEIENPIEKNPVLCIMIWTAQKRIYEIRGLKHDQCKQCDLPCREESFI